MKKKIKVVLLKDNIKKEKKGSIINVNRGYAFNYLIPNNIAEIATKNKIKHASMIHNIIQSRKEANKVEIELLKNNIQQISNISIYKKQGENNYIFGKITEKEILRWIIKNTELRVTDTQIDNANKATVGIEIIKVKINNKTAVNLPTHIIPINI